MNFWRTFFRYVISSEMRAFWITLPFLVFLLILNFIYLPGTKLSLIGFAVILALGLLLAAISIRSFHFHAEIEEERSRLQSVIENLGDGVVAYDPNFRIVIFNSAAEDIFGLSRDEVSGIALSPEHAQQENFRVLIQTLFPSLAPSVLQRSKPGTYPQIVDISFTDPMRELRVFTDRIADSNGNVLLFMKVVHDRTREVQLIRAKSEFITVAAHQLRGPLTAVHWSFESLRGAELPEEQKNTIESGVGAAAKLLKIVNDLLDASKIEEGKFGYQFEEIEFVPFIEDSIREMQELASRHRVKLYLERPKDESIRVTLDTQKAGMILYNLLDNAIRYNVENGQVVVSIAKLSQEPFVQVTVKDTGIGVPSEQLPKLFTKFFRAGNVMKVAPEGSGLGLYIVKNIVRRHGGKIWVESELNRGTTFHFTLPTDASLIPPREIMYDTEEERGGI